MIHTVVVTRNAQKDLRRAPELVKTKLQTWVVLVQSKGLMGSREVRTYHDEALVGDRQGQRSIRLTKGWRAIYETKKDGTVQFVEVQEVTNHEY